MKLRQLIPSSGFWAVLLLIAVLVMQYLTGFVVMQIARTSKESDLQEHLTDLGRLAQQQLREPSLSLSDLALDASLARGGDFASADPEIYRQGLQPALTQPFDDFMSDARLARVALISENGRVLYDTSHPDRPLQSYEFLSVDGDNFDAALKGKANGLLPYRFRRELTQRYYVPVTENKNATIQSPHAVLCLVAGKSFLGDLDNLARRLRRLGLVITCMMGVVVALIYSLTLRQRRMEQRAARSAAEADRLAGLGTLAAGFAHELRNPLGIIRATTEDLAKQLSESETQPARFSSETNEVCRDIIEEVDRMNRLVSQFLSFSKVSAQKSGVAISGADAPVMTVRSTVESVLAIARSSAEKRQIKFQFDAERLNAGARVAMDPAEFKQVLLNLLLNAVEAGPHGSVVQISLAGDHRWIEMAVSDSGPGVAPENISRIFDPFFTTKPTGAGLGLAISRQLIIHAGGKLELDSQYKMGARFMVTLPGAVPAVVSGEASTMTKVTPARAGNPIISTTINMAEENLK